MKTVEKLSDKICTGCGACAAACPAGAIEMREDNEGFLYPHTGPDCVGCGKCQRLCPAINRAACLNEPKIFAFINGDEKIRESSSSGGAFWRLCESMIAQGGAVYGAAMDEVAYLSHRAAYTLDAAEAFRGSKYMQSFAGDCYPEIEQLLKAGKAVLFSGTPCQCAGLRAFLGRDYQKLIVQDIICHGVPSQKTFRAYLEELETAVGRKARSVAFRSKRESWRKFGMQIDFEDAEQYYKRGMEDPYFCAFNSNLFLRPSCYCCPCKALSRNTDLTLADFWGVENLISEPDDDRGVSLVMLNTEKGHEYFAAAVKDGDRVERTVPAAVTIYNSSCVFSAAENSGRDRFFGLMKSKGFSRAVKISFRGGANLVKPLLRPFINVYKKIAR